MKDSLVSRREDLEYDLDGEVGTVPYGIYPRDRPLSLLERVHPGPQVQLKSLYDLEVPP